MKELKNYKKSIIVLLYILNIKCNIISVQKYAQKNTNIINKEVKEKPLGFKEIKDLLSNSNYTLDYTLTKIKEKEYNLNIKEIEGILDIYYTLKNKKNNIFESFLLFNWVKAETHLFEEEKIINVINNCLYLKEYKDDIAKIISEYSHEFVDLKRKKKFIELFYKFFCKYTTRIKDHISFLRYLNCLISKQNRSEYLKDFYIIKKGNLEFFDIKKYLEYKSNYFKKDTEEIINGFINTHSEIYFYLKHDVILDIDKVKNYNNYFFFDLNTLVCFIWIMDLFINFPCFFYKCIYNQNIVIYHFISCFFLLLLILSEIFIRFLMKRKVKI